jgi:endoglucanase
MALETLARVKRANAEANLMAVFTRAEEVGLIGALEIARRRLLPDDAIVVSLECSATLPGAGLGSGPVIRVGDRGQSFHPDGEAVLLAARAERPSLPVQRQLMSGGRCEASAFAAHGYRTTGLAIAANHLHNHGPDRQLVPESISRRDYLGGIELLVAAAAVDPADAVARLRAASSAGDAQLGQRLRDSAGPYTQLGDRIPASCRPPGP